MTMTKGPWKVAYDSSVKSDSDGLLIADCFTSYRLKPECFANAQAINTLLLLFRKALTKAGVQI